MPFINLKIITFGIINLDLFKEFLILIINHLPQLEKFEIGHFNSFEVLLNEVIIFYIFYIFTLFYIFFGIFYYFIFVIFNKKLKSNFQENSQDFFLFLNFFIKSYNSHFFIIFYIFNNYHFSFFSLGNTNKLQ